MSKFDLEKALKGEPVVLRNGTKAYVRHHETELDTEYPLVGYRVTGRVFAWKEAGHCFSDEKETGVDIVGMWHEPLVFEHWDLLSEKITHLAKERDGWWFGYSGKPSKGEKGWDDPQRHNVFYTLDALNPSLFPDCDWENSLIERPEK